MFWSEEGKMDIKQNTFQSANPILAKLQTGQKPDVFSQLLIRTMDDDKRALSSGERPATTAAPIAVAPAMEKPLPVPPPPTPKPAVAPIQTSPAQKLSAAATQAIYTPKPTPVTGATSQTPPPTPRPIIPPTPTQIKPPVPQKIDTTTPPKPAFDARELSAKIIFEDEPAKAKPNLMQKLIDEKATREQREKEEKERKRQELAKLAQTQALSKTQAQAYQQQLKNNFARAQNEFTNGNYQQAISLLEDVIRDKQTGWWLRRKAEKLNKKAQKQLVKTGSISVKPAAPAALPVIKEKEIRPAPSPAIPAKLPATPAPPRPPMTPQSIIAAPIAAQPPKTTPPASSNRLKFVLAGIVLLAVIGAAGIWVYYSQLPGATPPASPSLSQSLLPSAPVITESPSLFQVDDRMEMAITAATSSLASLTSLQNLTAGNFVKIVPKTADQQDMTLNDLVKAFNLTESREIEEQLENAKYTLFVYSQATQTSSPFSGGFTDGRVGIVIEIDELTADAETILKQAESDMLRYMADLLLGPNFELPKETSFMDNDYQGVQIRYFNLTGPELSLDWAIKGNQIIFATSKESMFAVIDRLQ